jgi:FkbH-like protein
MAGVADQRHGVGGQAGDDLRDDEAGVEAGADRERRAKPRGRVMVVVPRVAVFMIVVVVVVVRVAVIMVCWVAMRHGASMTRLAEGANARALPRRTALANIAPSPAGAQTGRPARLNSPTGLDAKLTEADVDGLFEAILRRPCDNPQYRDDLVAAGVTLRRFITILRASPELRGRMRDDIQRSEAEAARDGMFYRCPRDLAPPQTPVRRVLLLGSCIMTFWEQALLQMSPPCPADMYLTWGELPAAPAHPVEDYDFQMVHLQLRTVMPDGAFARLAQHDLPGHERLFDHCVGVMRGLLADALRWNRSHGLLTFVLSFVVPQQNAVGRLLPRFDLRNPVYFVEQLNQAMAREIGACPHVYYVDLNEILGTHGRRFAQEDPVALLNHGAFLNDFDFPFDRDRLEPSRRITEVYQARIPAMLEAIWQELLAMLRTLRQTEAVKLVVVDLDDTLWRGAVAEMDLNAPPTAEGWPCGFWEALAIVKRRGVLLGILSQNDEARVIEAWDRIFSSGQLKLEDFAVRRIDWRPKSEKMAEVLDAVNLLPGNVVYIDDNPAQRAEVKAAFPELRVLGGDPFTWRHILLWSAETQPAAITAESGARTEMVQAQVAREADRATQTRAEFLASLQVRMDMHRIIEASDARFARVLELINKTNQFNTTGERWTPAEFSAGFAAGVVAYAFDLADVYTAYGLVGVLIVDDAGIRQFVMSCRVMGLEAELAAVAHLVAAFRMLGRAQIAARMIETARNLPCRTIYERCGFHLTDSGWQRETAQPPPIPAHITLIAPAPAA